MGITFGGFATGLDTNAIIDAYVKAERVPIDKLTSEKSTVEAASQTISTLTTKLSTLREAAAALSDPNKFAAMGVSSSDTAIVATAAAGAAAGRYDIEVTQLAKEQRTYSNTFASGTDALGSAGTLSITVGAGTAIDVDVEGTDSLSAIAAKINASGARVNANVLYDGQTYRLSVRGLDTGASNAITFGETGISLGLDTPANVVQSAQDAQLKVDGITVTRTTNQVTGIIQGVTLALTKVTTGAATITVASDPASLKTKINTFVTAYNDVVRTSQTAAGFGSQAAANSLLSGDSTIRNMLNRLSRVVGNTVSGTTGKYTTLMSVGIASTKEGQLRFDDTKLAEALSADPTAVAKLFTKDANLGSTGAFDSFKSVIESLSGNATSPLRVRIDSLQKQSSRMSDSIDAMERRIDSYTTMLRKQFSDLEATVSQYKSAANSIGSGTSSSS